MTTAHRRTDDLTPHLAITRSMMDVGVLGHNHTRDATHIARAQKTDMKSLRRWQKGEPKAGLPGRRELARRKQDKLHEAARQVDGCRLARQPRCQAARQSWCKGASTDRSRASHANCSLLE